MVLKIVCLRIIANFYHIENQWLFCYQINEFFSEYLFSHIMNIKHQLFNIAKFSKLEGTTNYNV
jgi:hypothetical protein